MPIFLILLLVLISFLVFSLAIFYLITRYRRVILLVCAGFVVLGFSLYTYGYLSSGTDLAGTLHAALRGIFSTARMFAMNEDYGILVDVQGTHWLTGNIWMQVLLWLCYVSTLIIVQTALIALFGRKLVDKFRLRFGFHEEVYIIKGTDENALLLGENLATHDASIKKTDKKRLIVFLLEEDGDEEKIYKKTPRFGGVVQMLDRENDLVSCVKKADFLRRWFGYKRIYNIILMPNDVYFSHDIRNVAEYANNEKIPHENLCIFAFTLSEWDRKEIEEITQEKQENDDKMRKYPYNIHITNEVDIITRQMIEKYPPFECSGLSFSNKGEASKNFTVMILGFGAVGQRAFLRLAMNGQFVRSSMRAIIIDNDMDNLRDCFLRRYPELELCCDIEFKNFDVRREEFFKIFDEVNNIDYIVIALCSDEINKQTALDIRMLYERKDIKALPFIVVLEKRGGIHKIKQDEKIFLFGCREEVYKESVIIRAEIDRMAKAVNEVYGGQPWYELDLDLQESNRAAADFISAMLKLAKCKTEEAKNKNSLTGDSLLAEILAQTEHLRWNAFHAAMGYRLIGLDEMRKRFEKYDGERNTGKHLEFCRRETKARLHACLVPWDELDKITEVYRELAHRAGNLDEQKRNFKENDRKIIENIPSFLKRADEKQNLKKEDFDVQT